MNKELTPEEKQFALDLRHNGFNEKDIEFLCSHYEDVKIFLKWYEDKGSPDPKEFLGFLEFCRNNYVLLSFAVNILKAKRILEAQQIEKTEFARKLKGVFVGSWNGWLDKLAKETGIEHQITDDERFHWLIVTQAAGVTVHIWRDLFNDLLKHDYDTFLEIYNELKDAGLVPYNLPEADESLPDEDAQWIDFSQLGIMSDKDFAALLLAPPELNQPFPPGHAFWKVFGVTNVTEAEALGIWRFIRLANSSELRQKHLGAGLFALRNKESYKGREKFIRDPGTLNKAIDNRSIYKGRLYRAEDEDKAEEVAEDPHAADFTNIVDDQMVVAQALDIVKSGKDPKDYAVLELYYRAFNHGISLEQEYMREVKKFQALGLNNVDNIKQRFHRLRKKFPELDKLKWSD